MRDEPLYETEYTPIGRVVYNIEALKKIKYLNNFVIGNLKADYTFLHILPHKLLAKRIGGKKNKYDNYSKKF